MRLTVMGLVIMLCGWGESITCVSMPFSSTICCTMWPGGTDIGIGNGGPLFDTILTVAGPEMRESEDGVRVWLRKVYTSKRPHW